MGFALADLLHDAEVVDEGEEVATGEVSDGLVGLGTNGVTKFIDLGTSWAKASTVRCVAIRDTVLVKGPDSSIVRW